MPHGHWKTTTFVAGLRLSGMVAPFVLEGPINRDVFRAYIGQVLVPASRPATSSSWTTCKATRAGRAGGDRGGRSATALPPRLLARTEGPRSDFNPIERAFAKLKALLRKAAERTVEGLWTAIGRLIETFKPYERENYFAAAGYEPNQKEDALKQEVCS